MAGQVLAAVAAILYMRALAGSSSPPTVRETIRTVEVMVPVPVPVVPVCRVAGADHTAGW